MCKNGFACATYDARASLGKLERLLMRFTRAALNGHADFDHDDTGFRLTSLPQRRAWMEMHNRHPAWAATNYRAEAKKPTSTAWRIRWRRP
jgi:hypothetical protein